MAEKTVSLSWNRSLRGSEKASLAGGHPNLLKQSNTQLRYFVRNILSDSILFSRFSLFIRCKLISLFLTSIVSSNKKNSSFTAGIIVNRSENIFFFVAHLHSINSEVVKF